MLSVPRPMLKKGYGTTYAGTIKWHPPPALAATPNHAPNLVPKLDPIGAENRPKMFFARTPGRAPATPTSVSFCVSKKKSGKLGTKFGTIFGTKFGTFSGAIFGNDFGLDQI